MTTIYLCLVLGLLGATLGSFAGATVWRLRARQLQEDAAVGENDVDKKELDLLKPLTDQPVSRDRSQCLYCHHTLAWYDLLPVISWVMVRGRCRYCHRAIGYFEPLIEISLAAFFIVSYLVWPDGDVLKLSALGIIQFCLWLLAGVMLAILWAYDAKWFLLPNKIMFPLIVVGAAYAAVVALNSQDPMVALLNTVMAVIVLSGLYLLLYVISRGAWVGFGDVKLGLALALLLADWKLAVFALFAANVVGCLVVLPGMASRRISRKTHVPFGPMLIAGWILAGLFGGDIIEWYMQLMMI